VLCRARTPNQPTQEDVRKLHAEINQILNQRFLLTTAAITVFGVFASFTLPKDTSTSNPNAGALLFAGSLFLLGVLLLLFVWNRSLANLQSNLAIYLDLTGMSVWERHWSIFHPKMWVFSTGRIQTSVFLLLGFLTALWPFIISGTIGLEVKCGWMIAVVSAGFVYAIAVGCLGFGQWFRKEDTIRSNWKEVLEQQAKAPDQNQVSGA